MMANASTKAIGKAITVAASTIIIGIGTGIVTIAIMTATKGAPQLIPEPFGSGWWIRPRQAFPFLARSLA
jgi:F0F1-type ATP synthase membrane subunit c/vacuolar-type H+-ATPase subunit K